MDATRQPKRPGTGALVITDPKFMLQPALARLLLVLITIFPSINTMTAGFVLDDMPLIVENSKLHAVSSLGAVWTSGYWPDRVGLTLYRPVIETLWLFLWTAGEGRAVVFHVVNVCLAAAVTLLIYELLLVTNVSDSGRSQSFTAFAAAAIFAVLPVHTEAVASIVGSAELLAVLFGCLALLAFRRNRAWLALLLFALAVFSKESAAAIAAIGWFIAPRPRSRHTYTAIGAASIIALALICRTMVATAPPFIPPIDNPTALLPAFPRILTALWVQCLYLGKTIFPITLSADYSYKEVPLVMGLTDLRAWFGIALCVAAVFIVLKRPVRRATRSQVREPSLRIVWRAAAVAVVLWVIFFSPTANILFPIGTLMAERLTYAPSIAIALLFSAFLSTVAETVGARTAWAALAILVVLYGMRTEVRNRDWHDADVFYRVLVRTAPNSCKSHYFYGTLLASEGDDSGAVREYDRAIAIFAAYSEAYHNRGNALARLGRYNEAMESFRLCLRFDPGHAGAARNLATLQSGLPLSPPRRRL
jgi:tetratricopeptide (TPR) repeat protein